jgi:arylsulfatase A-like enzyme
MVKSLLPSHENKKLTYMTDALGAEAAAFIERHQEEPWFVYLPFGAVHAPPARRGDLPPQSAPRRYKDRFAGDGNLKRRTYLGMELAMDDAVGVVLAKLRDLKLEENTLIFFLSDNGGPTWQTTSRNDPLQGAKGDVLEGGIRVPFIIQWKGRLPAGRVDDRPVIQLDILPTVLAAAGVSVSAGDALDGENLLPYLSGEKPLASERALCWRYGNQRAIRVGDWKLVGRGEGAKLYNLKSDIGERSDRAAEKPDMVKQLEAAYEKWNARNIPPKWGSRGRPVRSDSKQSDKTKENTP